MSSSHQFHSDPIEVHHPPAPPPPSSADHLKPNSKPKIPPKPEIDLKTPPPRPPPLTPADLQERRDGLRTVSNAMSEAIPFLKKRRSQIQPEKNDDSDQLCLPIKRNKLGERSFATIRLSCKLKKILQFVCFAFVLFIVAEDA